MGPPLHEAYDVIVFDCDDVLELDDGDAAVVRGARRRGCGVRRRVRGAQGGRGGDGDAPRRADAAAEWREKNRAFQRENCTDVDPGEKLLDGDAARPTTIFDDDQGTCAAARMTPAPSTANRARKGS